MVVRYNNRGYELLMRHLEGMMAVFKVTSISFQKDIKHHAVATEHIPELILNNFDSKVGVKVGRLLASLFLKIRSLREEESLHSTIKEISYFSGIIDTFLLKATRESTCKKSVQDLLCKSRKFTLELRKKLEDYSFKQKITCMSKEKLFTYDFKCFCFLFTFLIKAKLIVP
jgi:hypothetical protein